MKHLSWIMLMFLLIGCKTTPSAELETLSPKMEIPKTEDRANGSPFANTEIPTNIIIQSVKPVVCGEIASMLNNISKNFEEYPIMVGKSSLMMPNGEQTESMVTLTWNAKTGSFSFLEQMPIEDRLICLLASGKARKLEKKIKKSNTNIY